MGHCCPHYFVSRRGFTARPQATFLSPTLPASTHIWQCVEASWLHPLKARAPVAGLVCFFRMQGHAVALFPSTPPLKEALAAQLLPQMVCKQELLPPITSTAAGQGKFEIFWQDIPAVSSVTHHFKGLEEDTSYLSCHRSPTKGKRGEEAEQHNCEKWGTLPTRRL